MDFIDDDRVYDLDQITEIVSKIAGRAIMKHTVMARVRALASVSPEVFLRVGGMGKRYLVKGDKLRKNIYSLV